jgi:hypothetical protein
MMKMSFIMSIIGSSAKTERHDRRRKNEEKDAETLLDDARYTSTVLFLFSWRERHRQAGRQREREGEASSIIIIIIIIITSSSVFLSFYLLFVCSRNLLLYYLLISLSSSAVVVVELMASTGNTGTPSADSTGGRIDVVSLIVLVSYPKHYRIFAEKERVLEILPNASESAFVWFGNYSAEKDEHPLVYMDVLSKMIRLGYQISASTGGGGNPAIGDNMSTHTSHYILIRKRE